MAAIDPPEWRECERCGRVDKWDDEAENWTIVEADGERLTGEPACIHEWDITGAYSPLDPDPEA